jgi:hypothetical protein
VNGTDGNPDPQQELNPAAQAANAASRARDLIERAREASSWTDLAAGTTSDGYASFKSVAAVLDSSKPALAQFGAGLDQAKAAAGSAASALGDADWLVGAREALAAEAQEVVMDTSRQPQFHSEPQAPTSQPAAEFVPEHVDAPASAYTAQPMGTDRLPWLESADEEDAYGIDSRRVMLAAGTGLALLLALVGGIWFVTHRSTGEAPVADGGYVAAPSGSFKEAPSDPGGKQYAGTGDTSYAASQGEQHLAQLGGDNAVPSAGASFAGGAPVAAPSEAAPKAAPVAAPADDGGPAGGVVQIAAYTSDAAAQAGWNRLVTAHESLKGMNHRIVAAKIDLGTVYRLQLVTGAGGGVALCERLKAEALPCQVKH